MKKFDSFLKVLLYYHDERCKHANCSCSLFAVNLRYLYVQNTPRRCYSVVPLQHFCRLKFEQFNYCRYFIEKLIDLEKTRLIAEKQFHKTLELWNKPPTPPPETNGKI